MKARLTVLLMVVALVSIPMFVSAVNRPREALGVAEFNQVESVAILVGPNNQSINILVFDAYLTANAIYTVDVLRNDTCAAPGFSLTGPIGPFTSNNLGFLNASATVALVAPIDQSGTQNIAVRIIDANGSTVHCGNVVTTNPGGAGRHWW